MGFYAPGTKGWAVLSIVRMGRSETVASATTVTASDIEGWLITAVFTNLPAKEGLMSDFEKLFDFELTPEQKKCIKDIEKL